MSDRKLDACEALNEIFRKLRHGWCAQRPGRHLSLEEALSLAGELIAEGSQDVFIGDGNDNQIGGEELAACCRGEKKLTPDLRAVWAKAYDKR